MFRNPFQQRVPRGLSWVAWVLVVLAIFLFGNMILGMVMHVAFTVVHLVVELALLAAILFGLFYAIKFVSRKTEGKGL